MRRHNACLKPPDADANGIGNISFAEPENTTKEMSPIEARQRERHAIVHSLLAQGHGIRQIARELHMGGNTVRRAARAETPEQMPNGRHQPRPSQLDSFKHTWTGAGPRATPTQSTCTPSSKRWVTRAVTRSSATSCGPAADGASASPDRYRRAFARSPAG